MTQRHTALSAALQVQTLREAQDTVNALLLCESVYKAADNGPEAAQRALTVWKRQFGDACTLTEVQCSLPHVAHRYLLGSTSDALYVGLMGTKEGRDLFTDFNFWQRPLWRESDGSADQPLTVHGGFLGRSRHIPAEALYAWAQQHKRRLVLCGHSLGGAIAVLCTLRLLRELGDYDGSSCISCITFGMPALGNAALADHVSLRGWHQCFTSFVLPEDIVPRLMSSAGKGAAGQLAISAAADTASQASEADKALTASESRADDLAQSDGSVSPSERMLPGYLRSFSAVQRAAFASARSLQQTLLAQPRFVHFGSHRSLQVPTTTLPPNAAMEDSVALPSDPQEGSYLLLAAHRMPAYRARVLALVCGPPARTPEQEGHAAAAVALSNRLAPQLKGVRASMLHPPLPPQLSRATASGMQQRSMATAARRWLPGARGSDAAPASGSVHLQIQLQAPGNPAALRSISSVRLRPPGGQPLPTRWLHHAGPPPVHPLVVPGETAGSGPASDRMQQWLQRWLRRSPVTAAAGASDDDQSVLEAELPAAFAAQVLASPAGLSLTLRSDFAAARALLQLHRHQMWVLGDSASAASQLLGSLAAPSRAGSGDSASDRGSESCDDSGVMASQNANGATPAWARGQAWLGNLWPSSGGQQAPSGLLAIGAEFTDFCSGGGSITQQCIVLRLLLGRAQSPRYAGAVRQHMQEVLRRFWAAPAGRRMLQEQRLPDMLLCIVSQAASDLQAAAVACAAAAAAGIEVLIASNRNNMEALAAGLAAMSPGAAKRPALVRLEAGAAGADTVPQVLYQMMLRVHARCTALPDQSKL